MPKDKKPKRTRYRDLTRTTDRVPQPKGEFVDLFKVMQERTAVRRAAAEVTRSHNKPKPSSNQPVDNAIQTHTEMNSMPKDKKFKPTSYRDFPSSIDKIPQPEGKFVNPFTAMRERKAKAEREANSARARQQNQTR